MITLTGQNASYRFSENSLLKHKGKFGSVYTGTKTEDNSKVIIKQLDPAGGKSNAAIMRFMKEAYIRVDHPGIAKTLDFITKENHYYLVREYVEGLDYSAIIKKHAPGKRVRLVFSIICALKVLQVLDFLHQMNIFHRDIRPSNIMVKFTGDKKKIDFYKQPEVKLIDLGLAKIDHQEFTKDDEKVPFALIYSPPEQVLNHNKLVNASSDIYSLGVTLYQMITLKTPFQHNNPEILMNLMLTQELPKKRIIPEDLFNVLMNATAKYRFPLPPNRYPQEELEKMLASGQASRYQSAKAMQDDLENVLSSLNFKKSLL